MSGIVSVFFCTLVIVALSEFQIQVEACSCAFAPFTDHYCSSDYAVKAKVKKVTTINQEFRYKIKIKKVFKLPAGMTASNTKFLWATTGFASCPGVHLTLGEKYYLVGNLDNQGRLYAGTCTTSTLWTPLAEKQQLNQGITC